MHESVRKSSYLETYFVIVLMLFLGQGFFKCTKASESQALSKITFDLSIVSSSGLIGTGDGVRSMAYEFCIPAKAASVAEVTSIDPSLQVYPHSRGRIGCDRDQFLCIGDTHQERWREKLLQLANLAYIDKIQAFYGE